MTIRHLRIFTTVCECNSVTGAAGRLYMTQPAVSLAIRELEEHYGIRLFDRLSRRIRITEDGRRMLEYALNVVSLFDEMEKAMKNPDPAGEIRIGGSLTIGACLLPGYTKALQQKCPDIRPHVVVDNTDRIVRAVREGSLDIGLVEGAVSDKLLTVRAFMEDSLIAVCGRAHAFADGKPVSLERFLSQPLLLRERGSGTRELFQSAVTLLGKETEPVWESVSTTALLRAVEAGAGVSVLPEKLAAADIAAGRLMRVDLEQPSLRRSFYLIYHKNKYLSAGLKTFIDMLLPDEG